MSKVMGYIDLNYKVEDILDPNKVAPHKQSIIHPDFPDLLVNGQLCWAIMGKDSNPIRIDVYADEMQHLCIGQLHPQFIEIVSEAGIEPSRCLLMKKRYTGKLKIVSADCSAVVYKITIDPNQKQPLLMDRV